MKFDTLDGLVDAILVMNEYLSGNVEGDRKRLADYKETLQCVHALLEGGSFQIKRWQRELIVQSTNDTALSYLGLGEREYRDCGLREGAFVSLDFLIYLYKRMETERLPITYALEALCSGFEGRKDFGGLSELSRQIQSITAGRNSPLFQDAPDSNQTEARQRLELLLVRIDGIRQLQEQPSNDIKERTALAGKRTPPKTDRPVPELKSTQTKNTN